jgi:hypothetical protein
MVGGAALVSLTSSGLLSACGGGGGGSSSSGGGGGGAGGGGGGGGSGGQTAYPYLSVGSGANAGSLVQANIADSATGPKVQLKGLDFFGCEVVTLSVPGVPIWADSGGTPDWKFWSQWTPPTGRGVAAIARIPLNSAAWLGLTVAIPSSGSNSATWGTPGNADGSGNYRADVIQAIGQLQSMGWYVLLDLHWCAPQITLSNSTTNYLASNSQPGFADYHTGIPFWESLAAYFGTQATPQTTTINGSSFTLKNSAILFDLFNEPYMDSDSSMGTYTAGPNGTGTILNAQQLMLNGGYVQHYKQQNGYLFQNQYWQLAGFQQMLNAIRATGAQNICLISSGDFSSNLYEYPNYFPTDTISPPQLVSGWHAYCDQGNPYTASPAYTYPTAGQYSSHNTNQCMIPANNILAAGIPIIIGADYNDSGTACTTGAPHYNWMHQWCDMHNVSHIKWTAEPGGTYTQSIVGGYKHWVSANGYITDPTSTKRPAEGGGVAAFAWMTNQHPGIANPCLNRNTQPGWTFPTPSVAAGTATDLFLYNSQYDSGSTTFPQYTAFDVSVWSNAVGVSNQYLVAWQQNELTSFFDAYANGQNAYHNVPGSYTVDINTSAGSYTSGAYPTSGWVTIDTVSGEYSGTPGGLNAVTRRAHLVPATYGGSPVNWIRFNFTASQGSGANTRIAITSDLWAIQSPSGTVDGHFFVGDSLLLHSMYHGDINWLGSVTCLDFGSICYTGGFILAGAIATGGSGYAPGTYIDIPLTIVSSTNGANAIGNITVNSSGVVSAVTLQSPGYGFEIGDTLSVAASNVGGTGSGFVYTVDTIQSAQKYMAYTPLNFCGDMSGWKASDWANYCTNTYTKVFSDFPGKYVWLCLGTNAEAGNSQTIFQSSLQTLINAAQAAGKTVILEKLVANPTALSWVAACNATIATLLSANPSVIAGPDMSGWQFNFNTVHPDQYGATSQRIFRAQFACSM